MAGAVPAGVPTVTAQTNDSERESKWLEEHSGS